jgi:glyoxylase-like metal-dependent hydrolase (beta-lactamase superfamily II)
MLRRTFLRTLACLPAGGALLPGLLRAQNGVTISTLAEHLHLLAGVGGNIAILEGEDGLLLVDSGLPTTVEALLGATGKIGTGRVSRLINTHYHFDHTGGNVRLGADGARIIAHVNVRARLATRQTNAFLNRTTEPLAASGLPVETFTDKGRLAHGGETVDYRRLPPAHTDGDTVIVFSNANVQHSGDLFFNGMYPFIDYSAGGSLAGMAGDAELLLKSVEGSTRIIPGHGPLASKDDLKVYADMLAACLDIMNHQLRAGRTLDQMLAAQPFKAYDGKWGNGFMNAEQWIKLNYAGMAKQPA